MGEEAVEVEAQHGWEINILQLLLYSDLPMNQLPSIEPILVPPLKVLLFDLQFYNPSLEISLPLERGLGEPGEEHGRGIFRAHGTLGHGQVRDRHGLSRRPDIRKGRFRFRHLESLLVFLLSDFEGLAVC